MGLEFGYLALENQFEVVELVFSLFYRTVSNSSVCLLVYFRFLKKTILDNADRNKDGRSFSKPIVQTCLPPAPQVMTKGFWRRI